MDDEDKNYENIFSNSKDYINSSFYKITPDINNTTTTTTTINDDDDDEYIYDDSFMKIEEETNRDDDNNNLLKRKTLENLFDKYYLQKLNKNIKIYNINVTLYQETASVLENYFSSLFTSINHCYESNKKTIAKYKLSDSLQNIHRNYDPLLKYIRKVYESYKILLFLKINEIQKYLLTIEKQLLRHSWLLIQEIGQNIYLFKLSDNFAIEYYINHNLDILFDNIKLKLQTLFNDIISSFQ